MGPEYIELLSRYEPVFQWDTESEESFFEVTDDSGKEMEVWYPTLYSIKYPSMIFGLALIVENGWI